MGLGAGIDQSGVWQRLMEDSNGVVFCLADPNYFQYMVNDMGRAAELGKDLYVLTGQTAGDAILTREWPWPRCRVWLPGGREPGIFGGQGKIFAAGFVRSPVQGRVAAGY